MYYTALQYGADAHTILEEAAPLIRLSSIWIGLTRGRAWHNTSSTTRTIHRGDKVEKITANFMEYELPLNKKYDLLLQSGRGTC
jgi:hypothetical protein